MLLEATSKDALLILILMKSQTELFASWWNYPWLDVRSHLLTNFTMDEQMDNYRLIQRNTLS